LVRLYPIGFTEKRKKNSTGDDKRICIKAGKFALIRLLADLNFSLSVGYIKISPESVAKNLNF
jgi:hypothetical protein